MKSKQSLNWISGWILTAMVVGTTGCGKNDSSSASEDNSASGIAAQAVGGALSGSSSSGSQAFMMLNPKASTLASIGHAFNFIPDAYASASCPTFKSSSALGCSQSAGNMWLNYSACSFGGPASWTGTQLLSMSSGSASCGTFPNPGASASLLRQFVSAPGSTTPGAVTVTAGNGSATIDDATANLANFDNVPVTVVANGGYGTQVTFGSNGARSGVSIAHHISIKEVMDHSVVGNLTINEAAGASTRTVSGSVKVYHNLLKVVGTSTFNNVTHSDAANCCFPISGSISTVYAAGQNVAPTTRGLAFVGKTETLTFTGCGTANLVGADGVSASVTLSRCF